MTTTVTETWRRPRLLRLVPRGESELALGDGRIALALHDAQRAPAPTSIGPAAAPRTLEEIVAMAGADARWGRAFRQLKSEGLLEEQTLGQVMAGRAHRPSAAPAIGSPPAEPPGAPWLAPSRTAS